MRTATVPSSCDSPKPSAASVWRDETSTESGREGSRSVRSTYAAAPVVQVSPTQDVGRSPAHEGRRRPRWHVRGGRYGPVSEHEAAAPRADDDSHGDGES